MQIGIYKVICLKNNKIYIGQTHNYKKRVYSHKTDLRHNKHHNKHMQEDFNLYGEECFKFEFIEECEDSDLDFKEDYWINKLDSINKGYNLKTGGIKHNKLSEETKNDVSKALKGRKFTDIHKKRISEKLKNRVITEESKNKMKKTFKERKVSVGSKNPAHILTEKEVTKIKLGLASGILPLELSNIFKISTKTIYEIKRGRIWENVTSELNSQIKNGDKIVYKEKCCKAIEMFNKGYNKSKISRELKISRNTIYKLLKDNV